MNSHASSYIFALTSSTDSAFTCFFRTPFTPITNILPNPHFFFTLQPMLPLQYPLWRRTFYPYCRNGCACSVSRLIEKSDSPVDVCLSRRVWPQYSCLEVEGRCCGTFVWWATLGVDERGIRSRLCVYVCHSSGLMVGSVYVCVRWALRCCIECWHEWLLLYFRGQRLLKGLMRDGVEFYVSIAAVSSNQI